MIAMAAKAMLGRLNAMPRMYSDGVLIVGDSAGFLNAARLKGIHSAIKSGMLAAETIFDALIANDFSAAKLQPFEARVKESWIASELRRYRNFHAGFRHGRWMGMANAGCNTSPEVEHGASSIEIIKSPATKRCRSCPHTATTATAQRRRVTKTFGSTSD